ncbi:MAG TPA: ferredoxin--NADP reductase [Paraburkholderia sp.]|jgi:3-ketosteroid 9alpha-monooxygenase subunit B|uniref:ferredoxin--NADP reductase n=1 Tax=Paraburkholderia sp. TaxID=1926495 RepID=UPI002B48EBBA|nr:ferredoxin--NADP reductase [Paraburkholderia sp.]HKR47595.1 ferredoxin--NADP reductase [Paraburkholderia sp.]
MSRLQPRYHALRVAAVLDETADARSLVFDVPEPLRETFRYRPGQFLTLRLPVGADLLPRCYSMSSAPTLDAAPRVTVKRVAGGTGSNWVCDNVKPGDTLDVLAPSGVFTPVSLDGDFLLFAGGSGITPVYSILRSVLVLGTGRALLVYANRDEHSVIFGRELDALGAAYPQRFEVVHWLDSERGVPNVAQLGDLAREWRAAQAFICGPGAFMDSAASALDTLGVAKERVHVERFVSLPAESGVDAVEQTTARGVASSGFSVELEIALDGAIHRIAASGNETLLEAAVRAGLNPPFSCQEGMCASCMCQVLEGSVHLRRNEALDSGDLKRGWTLSCQAIPTSAHVRIKYPE